MLQSVSGWSSPAADLLHQRKQVSDAPVVRDLSVLNRHHINRFEMNLAMRRGNSQKRAVVSSVVGLVRGGMVSVRKLPADFGVKIGEDLTYVRIELPHACLVRSHSSSWLRGVVHKIICEEFFEDRISLCLELPRCFDGQPFSLHQRLIFDS